MDPLKLQGMLKSRNPRIEWALEGRRSATIKALSED